MEARQRREEDAAWRKARMQSWEWEKRDAEMRKGQFTAQHARMETERQARTTRILSRFWQVMMEGGRVAGLHSTHSNNHQHR